MDANQPQVYQPQTNLSGPNAAPATSNGTKSAVNPNSAQNMLQVVEIRDGVVIMEDGSYRSVIMVHSINFDLMSEQEKEAVEFSYQGFLNSLFFPIQIFIHSEKVDIDPYLGRLNKLRQEQANMLLGVLTEDYIYFMRDLAEQTNIMDKQFYIVIPYYPIIEVQKALTQSKNFFSGVTRLFNNKPKKIVINEDELNKAKTELTHRIQSVLDGLNQVGIQGLPLDTEELIELFYNTYNPDTAVRQKLVDFNAVNAPIVQKGNGEAPQPDLDGEMQS